MTGAEFRSAGRGIALFSYGFRPFFLGGALWAAAAMGIWAMILSGSFALPLAIDPISWHAHEFLFGYVGAVIAGFMLTAVPNWTGRTALRGGPLMALFAAWLLGRAAMATSAYLPMAVVAICDLAGLTALLLIMTREVVAGRNWRNLVVLALLLLFILGNALFHWEVGLNGALATNSTGLRLSLAAVVLIIALIGGRVVPAFTRNWLIKQGSTVLPVAPMSPLDKVALLALVISLVGWVIWSEHWFTGLLLLNSGILHLWRLSRWQGLRTTSEPLVLVLHAGYLFVPLGALGQAVAILWPDVIPLAAAQHLWTAGAAGLMTLAIMTRATLGHTGGTLTAGVGTQVIYVCVAASALMRVGAELSPVPDVLHQISSALWIAAFLGFALLFGPRLLRPREV